MLCETPRHLSFTIKVQGKIHQNFLFQEFKVTKNSRIQRNKVERLFVMFES